MLRCVTFPLILYTFISYINIYMFLWIGKFYILKIYFIFNERSRPPYVNYIRVKILLYTYIYIVIIIACVSYNRD